MGLEGARGTHVLEGVELSSAESFRRMRVFVKNFGAKVSFVLRDVVILMNLPQTIVCSLIDWKFTKKEILFGSQSICVKLSLILDFERRRELCRLEFAKLL